MIVLFNQSWLVVLSVKMENEWLEVGTKSFGGLELFVYPGVAV
jgi:hypothetical protein